MIEAWKPGLQSEVEAVVHHLNKMTEKMSLEQEAIVALTFALRRAASILQGENPELMLEVKTKPKEVVIATLLITAVAECSQCPLTVKNLAKDSIMELIKRYEGQQLSEDDTVFGETASDDDNNDSP